jgi:hypothetical protein
MLFGVLSLSSVIAYGQEKPYTEGSVWYITMIRVKPGMLDVYMRDVIPLRKKINEEAKNQGLVLSSHILNRAKYDAIQSKIVGSEEKQVQLMTKRTEVREIVGEKVMQELLIK